MARVRVFQAAAMPSNIGWCPTGAFYLGPVCGALFGLGVVGSIMPGLWVVGLMVGWAGWHGYWAWRFRRDPHVWARITVRLRVYGILFWLPQTKNVVPEKGRLKFAART